MTQVLSFKEDNKFSGVWINEVGHVLFIEKEKDSKLFFVSFAPSQEADPIARPYADNRLSIRMPARNPDDADDLIVRLDYPNPEPTLYLTLSETDCDFAGPCLIPMLAMYDWQSKRDAIDLSWLKPLKTYRFIARDKQIQAYQLVKYLQAKDAAVYGS